MHVRRPQAADNIMAPFAILRAARRHKVQVQFIVTFRERVEFLPPADHRSSSSVWTDESNLEVKSILSAPPRDLGV